MLGEYGSAHDRWGGANDLIDNWLQERTQLIVLFCALSESKPLAHDNHLSDSIARFCQILMDYCSAGHFEIYDQLFADVHKNSDGLKYIADTTIQLEELTSRCVDFNDKYQPECSLTELSQLPTDLSVVGEVLAERFEIEDKMLQHFHQAHKKTSETLSS